jgi:nickel/cobalt exporter
MAARAWLTRRDDDTIDCMQRLTSRALVATLLVAVGATTARAHPFGSFTVNRYARLEPGPGSLVIVYVVDYAEIPASQELSRFPSLRALSTDALANAPDTARLREQLAGEWEKGLRVSAGSTTIPLGRTSASLVPVPGVAGLPTLRLRLTFEGPWPEGHEADLSYDDAGAPDRLGWREIVLRAGAGVEVRDSSASTSDQSLELTRYPQDPNALAPQDVHAELHVAGLDSRRLMQAAARAGGEPGNGAAAMPSAEKPGLAVVSREMQRLSALLDAARSGPLSLPLVLGALGIAAGLGAAHALSPGHGKTIVGAYLVGSRGTARHALLLGLVVTLTHTAGVFALGLVTLFAARYVLPERLYPWLGVVSGAIVALIGASLFHERVETALGVTGEHGHWFWRHSHAPSPATASAAAPMSVRALVGLGVSGGILPCPSAIVLLLSAVALHRIGFGIVLIVAFSLGLASVLIAIGLVFVYASRFLSRFDARGFWLRALPVASALVVTVLGVAIAVSSLVSSGILGRSPRP